MTSIRTRFAPSPTGDLHIGGARTALFNWLFAKSQGGEFLLRVEDTDRERSTEEAVETILSGMNWLGLKPEQDPIFQSKRLDVYSQAALKLLKEGKAYPCYCTAEEIEKMREEARARGDKPMYDGRGRSNIGEALPTGSDSTPFVIRIKSPEQGSTTFKDQIVGEVNTPNSEIDDFIIFRSNGTPTYNFTVVVDDIEMKISHVIRGMDHISNTPKQLLVYEALEANLPVFAHVPMILGADKKKLSKRHGATSVFEYKKEGYLRDAFINYLARLGWSHGDQEIFSQQELEKLFSLDKVGKSDSVFDFDKLKWVNSEHIKKSSSKQLAAEIGSFLEERVSREISGNEKEQLLTFLDLAKERSKTLVELVDGALFIFDNKPDFESAAKIFKADIKPALSDFRGDLESLESFEKTSIEECFSSILEKHSIGFGKLGKPVRFALTGSPAGLGIPELCCLLGQDESGRRIEAALKSF